jgi:hypothetical protein
VAGIVGRFEKLSTHPCNLNACHVISSDIVTLSEAKGLLFLKRDASLRSA